MGEGGLFKPLTTILVCQGENARAGSDPLSRRLGATPLLVTGGRQLCRIAPRFAVDRSLPVSGVTCV